MDEKQLKIMLLFGSDASKAEEGLAQLMQRYKSLKQRAEELRQSLKVFRAAQQDTSDLEKELNDVEREMRQISSAARGVQGEIKGISKGTQDIRDNLFNLRDIGEKISQVGRYVGSVGDAILSPLMRASQLFLSAADQSDPLVMRWKSEMGEIQDAWLRIGRVATEELLPLLERASDFMDSLADFVEANPDLVKVALISAGGLKVAGQGLQLAGSTAMLFGALKQLGMLGGAGVAGGTMAGTGAAALPLLPLAGIPIGLGAYEMMAKSDYGRRHNLANLGQYSSVGAYFLGKSFGGSLVGQSLGYDQSLGLEWFRRMGEMTGVIQKQADAAKENAEAQRISSSALDAFRSYQESINTLEERYEEQRNAIVQQYARQRVQIEAEYERQRADFIQDFARQESDALIDYYNQRRKTAQAYRIETRRAEEDHRRRMLAMQKEHNRRTAELVDARDALGLAREMRSYEDQRRQAEQEHIIEMRRRDQDFARQIAEMEYQFAVQRQRRLRDFNQQLAEMDAQHAAQMQQLRQQEAERLKILDEGYEKEKQTLARRLRETILLIDANLLRGQAELQARSAKLLQDFQRWLQGVSFSPSVAGYQDHYYQLGVFGRAEGGYVDNGIYRMGERGREFVLSHQMTRRAEQIVGGSLTQESVLSALSGRTMRVDIHSGGLTLQQTKKVVQDAIAAWEKNLVSAL